MPKRPVNPARRKDVEDALLGLSDADLLRLQRLARFRARLIPALDWQDLLQEAIGRALDGRRRWPRAVDFMAFMRQTIRSIANEHWRREERKPPHSDLDDESMVDRGLNTAYQPERLVLAAKLLEEIQSLFAEDPQVLAILAGIAADEPPADIKRKAGMSNTQYASAQKRIRRGLANAFPSGVNLL